MWAESKHFTCSCLSRFKIKIFWFANSVEFVILRKDAINYTDTCRQYSCWLVFQNIDCCPFSAPLLWERSSSNYDPAEFIWISIITVLASSSVDILHMYYLTPLINACSIFLFSTSFTTDWQAAKIIRRQKRSSSINFSNLSPFSIFISFCSRSLLSLLKPEWSQSKQRLHNSAIWTSVMWRRTPCGMVSFCGRCWNKNANNACVSIQMWYRLVRLVEWCSSYIGRWWSLQNGLL